MKESVDLFQDLYLIYLNFYKFNKDKTSLLDLFNNLNTNKPKSLIINKQLEIILSRVDNNYTLIFKTRFNEEYDFQRQDKPATFKLSDDQKVLLVSNMCGKAEQILKECLAIK